MSDRFARRAFGFAGIYGLIVLVPQYFMEGTIARTRPPAITHPEYFYGFVGLALAWQFVFLLISRDPQRYRALMPVAVLEKLVFAVPAAWLFATGRLDQQMFAAGMIDLVLGVLFVISYLRTAPEAAAR